MSRSSPPHILTFDSSGADRRAPASAATRTSARRSAAANISWKTGKNDWQVSFERAFNSLDQKGGLFELDPDGEFVEVPFPEGTGKVTEVRYEGLATLSRPLAPNLDLQVAAGAEISHLDRVDDDRAGAKFFRPKGSIDLGWHPAKSWDISLKLRRRVGQISFYDFLAQPKLSQDRENAGNPDSCRRKAGKSRPSSPTISAAGARPASTFIITASTDIVDFIPIGDDGQGIGNLPRADRLGCRKHQHVQLRSDRLDRRQARPRLSAFEWTSVRDPLTGRSGRSAAIRIAGAALQLRHDIPHTQFAWSAYVQYQHYVSNYYLTEIYRDARYPVDRRLLCRGQERPWA